MKNLFRLPRVRGDYEDVFAEFGMWLLGTLMERRAEQRGRAPRFRVVR